MTSYIVNITFLFVISGRECSWILLQQFVTQQSASNYSKVNASVMIIYFVEGKISVAKPNQLCENTFLKRGSK
jgi:hypothetical protein